MFKMVPLSGLDLQQASMKIAPHSLQQGTSDCANRELDSGFNLIKSCWKGRVEHFSLDIAP